MWGGCMLFRAAEMRGDARGILRVRFLLRLSLAMLRASLAVQWVCWMCY